MTIQLFEVNDQIDHNSHSVLFCLVDPKVNDAVIDMIAISSCEANK
jgi:hypothetical protein